MVNGLEPISARVLSLLGSRGGAVVRALASHQCGLGSTPGPGVLSNERNLRKTRKYRKGKAVTFTV